MERFTRIGAEFPDFDLASLPEIPEAWTDDCCWHQDASPTLLATPSEFFAEKPHIRVFVADADPARRESPDGARFCAFWDSFGFDHPDAEFQSDDWQEILDWVAAEEASLLPERTERRTLIEGIWRASLGISASNDLVCSSKEWSFFEALLARDPSSREPTDLKRLPTSREVANLADLEQFLADARRRGFDLSEVAFYPASRFEIDDSARRPTANVVFL